MNCAEVRELTAAYVLRALEPDEQWEVEAHVAGCDLHEEIAGLRAAALAISVTAPDREPPPALRERLLARAAGRSGGHAVQPEHPAREGRPVLGWLQMEQAPALLAALAAAFAAIAIALGVWVAVLFGGDDGSSALVRRVSEDAIEARLVYVAEDATATPAIGGLTALGADEDYQLWVIRDGTPVGVGVFDAAADGTAGASFQHGLRAGDVIAVTIEPAGGSPQPTSAPLFSTTI